MNFLKKNKSEIILISLMMFACLYMYFGHRDRLKHLNEERVIYTIGEITDFGFGTKSPPSFTFIFFIDKQKRIGHYSIVDELALTINNTKAKNEYYGKKFLVKYSSEKPRYNQMYLDKPIPDSLYACNNCFWRKLPF